MLKNFKNGTSIALMIDQRVSEGIYSDFFNQKALTTTIPAQFVKKFGASVVPIYIERLEPICEELRLDAEHLFLISYHNTTVNPQCKIGSGSQLQIG